jgi:hypothetical protein
VPAAWHPRPVAHEQRIGSDLAHATE